jgi:hypothetical protein
VLKCEALTEKQHRGKNTIQRFYLCERLERRVGIERPECIFAEGEPIDSETVFLFSKVRFTMIKDALKIFGNLWSTIDPINSLDKLWAKTYKAKISKRLKEDLLVFITKATVISILWILLIVTLVVFIIGYWLILHSGQIQLTLG